MSNSECWGAIVAGVLLPGIVPIGFVINAAKQLIVNHMFD